jgi:AcrR family transcriptional regulator
MTATSTHGAGARSAGRPRDPERDRAILDAVMELLAEKGYEATSIEDVAHRAGVGKPTIYRRWTSKRELVVDALGRLKGDERPDPEGTVRERVSGYMEQMFHVAGTDRASGVFVALASEMHRSPELRDAVREAFVTKRRRTMLALLREGVERGELRPDVDVDLLTDMLFGPLFVRRLVTDGKITAPVARRLVDALFDGVGTGPNVGRRRRGPR